MYSTSISRLIASFKKLPSVGQRTAERFVFHLLNSGKKETLELMLTLKNLVDNVKSCEICWNFSDENPCKIDTDKNRDHNTICVVAEPQDMMAIERTGEYNGVYYILRGTMVPENEDGMKKIKIKELFQRIIISKNIKETILALNTDLAGETTALFIAQELKKINPRLKISRLARGLPMGSDLQYADDITLGSAMKNRTIG